MHHAFRRKKVSIYQSGTHLAAVIALVALPFLFFWAIAASQGIDLAGLFTAFLSSTARLAVAYGISVIAAWFFAVWAYRGKASLFALPVFDALQSFPTFAILPLATYMWGASNLTVIFFLIITVIWPIFFAIIGALKSIRADWEDAAKIVGLKGSSHLSKFILPISMPGVINGSIIGLGEGWEALIGSEIIVHLKGGLGGFFEGYAHDPMVTFLGVAGFLLFVFMLNKLLWIPLLEVSYERISD